MQTAAANPTLAQATLFANDAILRGMERESQVARGITAAKERGGAPLLLTLLEAVKPIAPVLASGLLAAEPVAALWGGGGALRELSELLDDPESLEALRGQLAEEPTE